MSLAQLVGHESLDSGSTDNTFDPDAASSSDFSVSDSADSTERSQVSVVASASDAARVRRRRRRLVARQRAVAVGGLRQQQSSQRRRPERRVSRLSSSASLTSESDEDQNEDSYDEQESTSDGGESDRQLQQQRAALSSRSSARTPRREAMLATLSRVRASIRGPGPRGNQAGENVAPAAPTAGDAATGGSGSKGSDSSGKTSQPAAKAVPVAVGDAPTDATATSRASSDDTLSEGAASTAGAPDAPLRAVLVSANAASGKRRRILMRQQRLVLGRARKETSDRVDVDVLRLLPRGSDPRKISHQHALVYLRDEAPPGLMVQCLGKNGLLLDGQRVTAGETRRLRHGSELGIAGVCLRVQLDNLDRIEERLRQRTAAAAAASVSSASEASAASATDKAKESDKRHHRQHRQHRHRSQKPASASVPGEEVGRVALAERPPTPGAPALRHDRKRRRDDADRPSVPVGSDGEDAPRRSKRRRGSDVPAPSAALVVASSPSTAAAAGADDEPRRSKRRASVVASESIAQASAPTRRTASASADAAAAAPSTTVLHLGHRARKRRRR